MEPHNNPASPEFVALVERIAAAETLIAVNADRHDKINGQIAALAVEIGNLRVDQAKTATRAAIMAAIGGAIGTGVAGAVVSVVIALAL